jgi:membrane-associated phospholipid phosphatase
MSEKPKYMSKNGLILILITFLAILIMGLILLLLGLNEEFYSTNSTVRTVFKAITYLGEPIVFVILFAIIFIVYNKNFAKNLVSSLLLTLFLNQWIKQLFKDTRPDTNIDPSEEYGLIETSYGFPSAHAQNAVGFWGYMAYKWKDKPKSFILPIIPTILSIIIFLIAISRIIVGVHDLQDIIGGLLIGIVILMVFIYLEPLVSKQFNKLSFTLKIIIAVIISILIFLIPTFLYPKAGVGLVPSAPSYSDNGAFGLVGGVILGFSLGYILEGEYIKYEPKTLNPKQKIINVIIGLIILLLIFLPLEYLLEIDSVFYRFARYAILAFVLTFILPILFKKINK